jgi:membrane protein DedA with SNARE-associated domain
LLINLKKFIAYTFIGSLSWSFALGYIGTKLGPNWGIIQVYFHILDIIVEIAILGIIVYLIYKYVGKSKLKSVTRRN